MNTWQRLVLCLLMVTPLTLWGETMPAQRDQQDIRPAGSGVEAAGAVNPQGVFHKVLIPFTGRQLADIDYQQALRFLSVGEAAQAQAELTRALKNEPLHIAARQLLATIYTRQQHEAQAIQLLAEGVQLLPHEPAFNMMLARLYGKQGQATRGIALLEKLHLPDSRRYRVDAMLAALYQRAARYDDAIELYRSLLQRNPRRALWWLGLAMSLEASQRPANALSAYQQARRERPGRALQSYIEARITALSASSSTNDPAQQG
jgi:MSHA biogenesis protein MshN